MSARRGSEVHRNAVVERGKGAVSDREDASVDHVDDFGRLQGQVSVATGIGRVKPHKISEPAPC